jgi:hypothetical protein
MRFIAGLLLVSSLAVAAPPKADEVPAVLKEWKGWVLHGDRTVGCPFLHGDADTVTCEWPGTLALKLDEKGGTFSQSFHVYKEAYLSLPGDEHHWPQAVMVDGHAAVVVPGGEAAPSVKLSPGEHTVTGRFEWDTLPESLAVPEATGILSLAVKGKPVPMPTRDGTELFLQRSEADEESELMEMTVHRLISDDIPLTVTTRVMLNVSGRSREVLLGRALPEGFVPMQITSPLPARLEADGRLRLQVRAGNWQVEVTARHEGPVTSLKRPEPDGPWAEGDEVWVFDARPSLRQVELEGVPALDSNQTALLPDWKRYPAYAVGEHDELKLTERRRGDADPGPDMLSLERTLWLDFEGTGYTVSDRITGQLRNAWRLEMEPRTELGRVVAGGADQSITRLEKSGLSGVELRQGQLSLEADSRIAGDVSELPAVSWATDFHAVNATLQLPPGWSLLSASGADQVPETWFQRWSLLDIFLVLLTVVAIGRLFGVGFGALALVTLTLTWTESEAPRFVWLAVLAGEALVRVLPAHWVRSVVRVYRFAAWCVLVVVSVSFMVEHVRHGMYPSLAVSRQLGEVKSWSEYSSENAAQYARSASVMNEPPSGGAAYNDQLEEAKEEAPAQLAQALTRKPEPMPKKSPLNGKVRSFNVRDYDKNAMVQTGPGLPRWSWTPVHLRFSGPVEHGQQLTLWLLGPTTNLVLALLRVLLLAGLALVVLGFPGGFWPKGLKQAARLAPSALLSLLLVVPGLAFAGDEPTDELLQEYANRLREKPACAPNCASSPRLQLEATGQLLRLRLEVLAGADTAIPLPGNAQHWLPETVLVDGHPTSALRRDGDRLWLALDEGSHQVLLEGTLAQRSSVQIELPLKPHRVETKLSGWSIDGVHEDGIADASLQLNQLAGAQKVSGALQTGTLPPFVRVERTLLLGLQWTVETRLVRLTPVSGAVVLEVPLLAGESITSSDVRVQGGKALVNMPSGASEVSWSSILEAKPAFELTAPTGLPWVEVWKLDVSPVWHITATGIPVVHSEEASVRMPQWRPWPGESVKIVVTKPEGVVGQTLTIDQSRLTVSPGVRATDVTFAANLRSSRGGLSPFTLPEGAQLQSVTINGVAQPIRQEGRVVSLPLVPGAMSVALTWRQAGGIGLSWTSPLVDLGSPTVNAEVSVQVPDTRWVLFTAGPRMGPAVLFWSFLLVLLLVSAGLSRVGSTPLKLHHWLLLALGLSQVPIPAIALVFGWLLLLGWRAQGELTPGWFNLRQLAVVALSGVALIILMVSVYEGLLGHPEMQIQGNGSDAYTLHWFQDRTQGQLPTGWIFSVPMLVYRGAMLAWSLWMAFALLRWLKWGWQAFSTGGLWKKSPAAPRTPVEPPKP